MALRRHDSRQEVMLVVMVAAIIANPVSDRTGTFHLTEFSDDSDLDLVSDILFLPTPSVKVQLDSPGCVPRSRPRVNHNLQQS